ncbi:hypothetical protein M413DRAFT_116471 [Hebeloma cylindrosporum]|uniref:Uncharacterized protein n=1 Tax=Hebeloma cylindrosporum TaxID=76867 RepID=A0A0C3D114_HEBCY|nr:hypothetical protein M413DRAFT_116471 [Hebeloma cylindrosporum h7]
MLFCRGYNGFPSECRRPIHGEMLMGPAKLDGNCEPRMMSSLLFIHVSEEGSVSCRVFQELASTTRLAAPHLKAALILLQPI